MRTPVYLIITLCMAVLPLSAPAASDSEQVILLHGLCRSSRSMEPMARALTGAGYKVWNINYPSRTGSIEQLSESVAGQAVAACESSGATQINFVTHSLGGILVRYYLAHHPVPRLGRVVMLAPPNQGSEIVDKLGNWWIFKTINGPTGNELGTGPNSVPKRLGRANFPAGIIAGTRSINWINSLMIPGCDDGKVAVERTKLAGMADWTAIPATHPFIMRNKTAIRQTIAFLRMGRFERQPSTRQQDANI